MIIARKLVALFPTEVCEDVSGNNKLAGIYFHLNKRRPSVQLQDNVLELDVHPLCLECDASLTACTVDRFVHKLVPDIHLNHVALRSALVCHNSDLVPLFEVLTNRDDTASDASRRVALVPGGCVWGLRVGVHTLQQNVAGRPFLQLHLHRLREGTIVMCDGVPAVDPNTAVAPGFR